MKLNSSWRKKGSCNIDLANCRRERNHPKPGLLQTVLAPSSRVFYQASITRISRYIIDVDIKPIIAPRQ